MNVPCRGSEIVGDELVRTFQRTRFDGGEQYVRRLRKIEELERAARPAVA
jgi:hypothetical protein